MSRRLQEAERQRDAHGDGPHASAFETAVEEVSPTYLIVQPGAPRVLLTACRVRAAEARRTVAHRARARLHRKQLFARVDAAKEGTQEGESERGRCVSHEHRALQWRLIGFSHTTSL